jgi:hypothetical protein
MNAAKIACKTSVEANGTSTLRSNAGHAVPAVVAQKSAQYSPGSH